MSSLFHLVLQNKYSQESDLEPILKHALSGVEDLYSFKLEA